MLARKMKSIGVPNSGNYPSKSLNFGHEKNSMVLNNKLCRNDSILMISSSKQDPDSDGRRCKLKAL